MLAKTGDKVKLLLFDNFFIDSSLPKFADRVEETDEGNQTSFNNRRLVFNRGDNRTWISNDSFELNDIDLQTKKEVKLTDSIIVRFFSNLFKKKVAEAPKSPKKTTQQIFQLVIDNEEQLQHIDQKLIKYNELIEQAKTLGQVALLEKLTEKWKVYCQEMILVEHGWTKVISEEKLVEFVLDNPKGIRLDWVKNFVRMIPKEVALKKIEADKIKIFDNYAILHYDPEGKATEMTYEEKKAEEERRRDPILFGVIKDSRKLYYIGDWKDAYCDLTWEEIAQKIDEKDLLLKDITQEMEN